RSETHPNQTYIGSTHDPRKRLAEHNAGKSIHTNKFKPSELMAYIALAERHHAEELERYLKSGSGRVCKEALVGGRCGKFLKLFPDPPLLRKHGRPLPMDLDVKT